MDKADLQKQFEDEQDREAVAEFSHGKIYLPAYGEWCERKALNLMEKAEAYDRLMSGGKKTLKEWANIFGKPIVVDSDDTILVFSSVPRYEGGYSQEGEFIDDWIGEVIAHIDCEYEGEYVDDVTLPDGWEEG